MKNYFSFFILLLSIICFSQKTLDTKMITDKNDTIIIKMVVRSNFFDKSLLEEISFNTKVTYIDNDGKKVKVPAENIKKLFFTDFKNKKRIFINNFENKSELSEVLYDGNIKWYRHYYSSNGSSAGSDFMYNSVTKKGSAIVYLVGLPRKKLKELTDDEPSLINYIDNMESSSFTDKLTSSVMQLLIKYDELKNKK